MGLLPTFQGLVVSTCYNFGEVGIRQRLPPLSKIPAAATKLAQPVGVHFRLFQESIPFSWCWLILVLGSAGNILILSVFLFHMDCFILGVYWFLFMSFLKILILG